jgi:hypothetical protein
MPGGQEAIATQKRVTPGWLIRPAACSAGSSRLSNMAQLTDLGLAIVGLFYLQDGSPNRRIMRPLWVLSIGVG